MNNDATPGPRAQTSRASRRRAAREARRLGSLPFDKVVEADAAFFDLNRGRSYRVRPAAAVEVGHFTAIEGLPVVPTDGRCYFAFVHQVRPGLRFRQFAALPADTDCDAGEVHARAFWDECASLNSEVSRIVSLAAEHFCPSADGEAAP